MREFNLKSYIKAQLHEAVQNFKHQAEIDKLLDKISTYGIEGVPAADLRRLKRLTNNPDDVDVRPDELPIEDRIELIAPPNTGKYIPMYVCSHKRNDPNWDWNNVSDSHLAYVKKGPDHPNYWEAWECIVSDLNIRNSHGEPCKLKLEGSLWLVPVGVDEEELNNFLFK
jgi:hypothetical protein